jgi:hypothetical protein
MKTPTLKSILIWQALILVLFLCLTATNEFFDLPHLLLGDQPTTWDQRSGEIAIEVIIFVSVITLEIYLFRTLIRRIKILEGFLPICANCKKIRTGEQWQQIESYISERSPVQFSHSLCPECREKLYPELFGHRH